jgi:hypothetical protein
MTGHDQSECSVTFVRNRRSRWAGIPTRTILHEELEQKPEVIEHQLAHAVPDVLGSAYNRTKFIKERRVMMQLWANYLEQLKVGAKVIPLSVATNWPPKKGPAFVDDPQLTQAADWIRDADGLLITAGAGIGIDSGLPDFRGPEGFWRAYPALRTEGLTFTEIANPAAFLNDARLAWGFAGTG